MADLRDYGPFEMAHGFDDPRKVEDDMFRIAAQNAEDANARLGAVTAERDDLLSALKAIVATDFLKNDGGVRQAIPVRWNRALEIAAAAIDKAEGK